MTEAFHLTVAGAQEQLASAHGKPYVRMLSHGTMTAEYFAPRGMDTQTPHVQDEIYVVISGTGEFVNGGVRHSFGPGDVMFVQSGVEHHFEEFSEDFAVWVFFYGERGGEKA